MPHCCCIPGCTHYGPKPVSSPTAMLSSGSEYRPRSKPSEEDSSSFNEQIGSILKRWKRSWFVLYANGELKYFETPDNYEAEETILVPRQVVYCQIGTQCGDVAPPTALSRNCLLAMCGNEDNRWQLCAESSDDARAWQIAIEQAQMVPIIRPRSAPPYGPSPYLARNLPSYPSPAYLPYPNSPYMYRNDQGYSYEYPLQHSYVNQNGERVVYVYDRRRRNDDFATGALAGAAVGSLFFWPLLFW